MVLMHLFLDKIGMTIKKTGYNEARATQISKVEDIDFSATYSYAHYLSWLFEDRVELIKGKVFRMGAPSRMHQLVLLNVARIFADFLDHHPCEIYIAPFDVRFPTSHKADEAVFTVLQPDLCVICDTGKLDDRGCLGAPDLIVEVISPGNSQHELFKKYKVYEEFGVREYWIVDFKTKTLLVYLLDQEGKFVLSQSLNADQEVHSPTLIGLNLHLKNIFTN